MANVRVSKRENPFVQIDKTPLDDTRLSWEAKGLHAYIMTKPDDWTINVKHLIKQARNGRDATYRIIRELIEAGYIERKQDRDENGKMDGTVYIVHEIPMHFKALNMENITLKKKDLDPHPENPDTVDLPHTENPDTENPYISNNDLNNNDFKKDDDDLTRVRAILFSEFVETRLLTESEFEDKLQHITKYETSDKLAYGRVAMLNHVRDNLEARTAVLKQLEEAKTQLAVTTSQEAVQTSQKPLHSKTKGNSRNKPIIPMIQDTPTTAVTLEELEEMRKVAKKLDGGGFIDA